jgi:excisionase family DNA binding protein
MDTAALFLVVVFFISILILAGIVFAVRAAESRAAAARARAASAEQGPKQFLYTKQQAATALGMSTGHLKELMRYGKITAVKDGRRMKFTSADLEAYAAALPSWGGPPAAEPRARRAAAA